MEIKLNNPALHPNKNYYDTFDDAYDFARNVMKRFPEVGQTQVGFDKAQGAYTVEFNREKLIEAHPMLPKGK